jgi:hypothetical protein
VEVYASRHQEQPAAHAAHHAALNLLSAAFADPNYPSLQSITDGEIIGSFLKSESAHFAEDVV